MSQCGNENCQDATCGGNKLEFCQTVTPKKKLAIRKRIKQTDEVKGSVPKDAPQKEEKSSDSGQLNKSGSLKSKSSKGSSSSASSTDSSSDPTTSSATDSSDITSVDEDEPEVTIDSNGEKGHPKLRSTISTRLNASRCNNPTCNDSKCNSKALPAKHSCSSPNCSDSKCGSGSNSYLRFSLLGITGILFLAIIGYMAYFKTKFRRNPSQVIKK